MNRVQRHVTNVIVGLFVFLLPAAALAVPITLVPTGLNPGDTYHLAFVTSTKRTALSGDIASYDAFVQAAANAPANGLENFTWRAVVSTFDGTNARLHVGVAAPVYHLNNTRIANGAIDLWDGIIQAALDRTETNSQ